jgi:hypothetical protein
MLASILALAIGPLVAAATSPALAVKAAYHDAVRLPEKERPFYRYLWWNKRHLKDYVLLTKSQQALLSTRKVLPSPVIVCDGLLRIDVRETGWEKRLATWEKFAPIDFVFHHKLELLEDATFKVYYPQGYYDNKWHDWSYEDKHFKKGDKVDRPAVTANPLVEVKPGIATYAQDELRRMLYSEVPILWGPFWFVRVGRQQDINNTITGVGYYEWYGIKNRDDFFNLTGTDEKKAVELFQELRAALDKSGISEQERQLVLLRGASGLVWGTLDVVTQRGRGQPARNLRRGEFAHDAEEWIGKNPLGLPINALFEAKKGLAQNTAPDTIGGNRSALNITNDLRISLDSCWDCHGTGKGKDYIVSFEDWVRRDIRKGVGKGILRDPDKKVTVELESAYLDDIYRQVKRDREDFAFAIARLTSVGPRDPGMTVSQFTAVYRGFFYRYVSEDVTLEIAADEMGIDPKLFLQRLKELNDDKTGRGALEPIIAKFLLGGTLRRLAWEDTYAYGTVIGLGMNVPELIVKEGKK